MKIFIEGGGDSRDLRDKLRASFAKLIDNAGIRNKPRLVACGSRDNAFDDFKTEIEGGNPCMLLVDSEEIPQNINLPWVHLKQRDNWDKPNNATDEDCHLMVVTMETWLISDKENLKVFYGSGFKEASTPTTNLETRSKADINSALDNASRNSSKGIYHKGNHSFKLLEKTNITLLTSNCPSAKRFFDEVKTRMG